MKILSITMLILLLSFCFNASAKSGDGVGNGGSSIEQSFASALSEAIGDYEVAEKTLALKIPASRLKDLAAQIKIVVSYDLLFDRNNNPKAAINVPTERRILVQNSAWLEISKDNRLMKALALHEALGLLGDDIEDYSTTAKLYGALVLRAVRELETNLAGEEILSKMAALATDFSARAVTRASQCLRLGETISTMGTYLQRICPLGGCHPGVDYGARDLVVRSYERLVAMMGFCGSEPGERTAGYRFNPRLNPEQIRRATNYAQDSFTDIKAYLKTIN